MENIKTGSDELINTEPQKKGKEKKVRRRSLADKNKWYGRMFILPWLIGAVAFFIVPLIQTAIYSFNDLTISANGLEMSFVGWKNYQYALTGDATFIRVVYESIGQMVLEVPVIVFFSLFIGMVLKDKFKGRTVARALFFLPVIIASGVVISLLKSSVLMSPGATTGSEDVYLFNANGLQEILFNMGISKDFVSRILDVISRIFDLTWKSGVQILLLMAALNNIPASSYEVASIEGATEWEKFWKITLPLVSPTILVTVIYSIIDNFTDYANPVMQKISSNISRGEFEYATTLGMFYFLAVLLLIGVVYFVLSRFIFYETD